MKPIVLLGLLAIMPAFPQQPKFELADIHVSRTPRWFAENYVQNTSGQIRDGRYVYRDANLLNLIKDAFGVTEDMVAGGPSWLKLDIYDVTAKMPDGTTPATAKLMLQSLLAERFGLVARRDTRPMPRFVLSVSKGGAKLTPAAKSEDSGCQQQRAGPIPTGPYTPAQMPNLKAICHNLTAQEITVNLRQMAGGPVNTYLPREVFDDTGLAGQWDFTLEFTSIGVIGDKGSEGITLFDAVRKQLGLNLELKDVPVPALVIESVNRNPTPNSPAATTDLGLGAARFEVATIKPVSSEVHMSPTGVAGQMKFYGTLRNLIVQAFMITPNAAKDVIIGLPQSADTLLWDITAKLPSAGEGAPGDARAVPRSEAMEMLRGLLSDEFQLKTHTENRAVTVYVMTLPGKPKMEQADGTERTECLADPLAVKPFPNMGTMVNCRNISMTEFAENLNQATGFFDHPIVDATGLKGGWNFKIGWSRPNQGPAPNPGAALGEATDPIGLTSYDAVERQMGVKLVRQNRSIPVIVVDHVNEKPLE